MACNMAGNVEAALITARKLERAKQGGAVGAGGRVAADGSGEAVGLAAVAKERAKAGSGEGGGGGSG